MTSIGEALNAEAQEKLRQSINERAKPEGWGLIWTYDGEGFSICPRWVGDDRWRNDQYEVLYDAIWELAHSHPDCIEAEALGWLRLNSPETYRRVRAGVRDTVPLVAIKEPAP